MSGQLKIQILTIVFSVVAVASANAFECESQSADNVLCLSLPAEAPEAFKPSAISSKGSSVKMASSREVSEADLGGISGVGTFGILVPEALTAASKAQSQLRYVEQFLKSGPASTGDLRVITSGRPE